MMLYRLSLVQSGSLVPRPQTTTRPKAVVPEQDCYTCTAKMKAEFVEKQMFLCLERSS